MAFYQGVRHILMPQPIVSPAISLGVLVVSALFEGWSFAVGFREYKRVVRGRDIPLWSFIKASKDPSLYGTLLEDFSAFKPEWWNPICCAFGIRGKLPATTASCTSSNSRLGEYESDAQA